MKKITNGLRDELWLSLSVFRLLMLPSSRICTMSKQISVTRDSALLRVPYFRQVFLLALLQEGKVSPREGKEVMASR